MSDVETAPALPRRVSVGDDGTVTWAIPARFEVHWVPCDTPASARWSWAQFAEAAAAVERARDHVNAPVLEARAAQARAEKMLCDLARWVAAAVNRGDIANPKPPFDAMAFGLMCGPDGNANAYVQFCEQCRYQRGAAAKTY